MMWALGIAVYLAFAVMIGRWLRHDTVADDARRTLSNARVLAVYRDTGHRWYPHEMADGSVRWYNVNHDNAVDL